MNLSTAQLAGLDRLNLELSERYSIDREIGRGGMAAVYCARDLRYDRQVALKILNPEFAATLGTERFEREIKLVARLQHPHILPVHDSGQSADLLWFAMPYVDGETLKDRLQREIRLPIKEALRIIRELGLALQHAHEHGIVHRDVKPGNVLLTRDGTALLSDFGIALATTDPTGRMTEAGMVVGTVGYMSPEQATADRTLDARSDIYSLGCVLYEMLAGVTPFVGRGPLDLLARQLTDPVPSLRLVCFEVSAAVDQAIATALNPVPAERFGSANQFLEALENSSGSLPATPPAIRHGTGDTDAYHSYLKGRYSLHAVSLSTALLSFQDAIRRDPGYAQAYAGLSDVYSSLGLYGLVPGPTAFREARTAAEQAIRLNPGLSEAHEARGKVEAYFGWDFPLMERELRRAIALNPHNPISHIWLGLSQALQGRDVEATREVALAFELEPRGPGGAVLGMIRMCAGQVQLALDVSHRILEFNPTSVQALWLSGLVHLAMGNGTQGVAAFEQAVALTDRCSLMLGGLGSACAEAGRRDRAREILAELLDRSIHSPVPPTAIGRIHFSLGEFDELFDCIERGFAERDCWVIWIAVWPGWQKVRQDPRYQELLALHGLAGTLINR